MLRILYDYYYNCYCYDWHRANVCLRQLLGGVRGGSRHSSFVWHLRNEQLNWLKAYTNNWLTSQSVCVGTDGLRIPST